jgi:hypothetical protein
MYHYHVQFDKLNICGIDYKKKNNHVLHFLGKAITTDFIHWEKLLHQYLTPTSNSGGSSCHTNDIDHSTFLAKVFVALPSYAGQCSKHTSTKLRHRKLHSSILIDRHCRIILCFI